MEHERPHNKAIYKNPVALTVAGYFLVISQYELFVFLKYNICILIFISYYELFVLHNIPKVYCLVYKWFLLITICYTKYS